MFRVLVQRSSPLDNLGDTRRCRHFDDWSTLVALVGDALNQSMVGQPAPSASRPVSRPCSAFSLTSLGTTLRRVPSANHLQGLRLLGQPPPALPWWTASLPALTWCPEPLPELLPGMGGGKQPPRPMTAFMQAEMASVVFKPRPSPRSTARASAVRRQLGSISPPLTAVCCPPPSCASSVNALKRCPVGTHIAG